MVACDMAGASIADVAPIGSVLGSCLGRTLTETGVSGLLHAFDECLRALRRPVVPRLHAGRQGGRDGARKHAEQDGKDEMASVHFFCSLG